MQVVINFDDEVECGGKASKTIQIGNVMSGGLTAAGDFAIEALSKEKLDLGWVISTGDGKVGVYFLYIARLLIMNATELYCKNIVAGMLHRGRDLNQVPCIQY